MAMAAPVGLAGRGARHASSGAGRKSPRPWGFRPARRAAFLSSRKPPRRSTLPRQLRHAAQRRQEEEGRGQVRQEGQGPRQQVRRQSQEEEVVQGEGEGQAEQPGPLRQSHLRQALQGGAQLQAHHARRGLREAEDPRVARAGCATRAPGQRSN